MPAAERRWYRARSGCADCCHERDRRNSYEEKRPFGQTLLTENVRHKKRSSGKAHQEKRSSGNGERDSRRVPAEGRRWSSDGVGSDPAGSVADVVRGFRSRCLHQEKERMSSSMSARNWVIANINPGRSGPFARRCPMYVTPSLHLPDEA